MCGRSRSVLVLFHFSSTSPARASWAVRRLRWKTEGRRFCEKSWNQGCTSLRSRELAGSSHRAARRSHVEMQDLSGRHLRRSPCLCPELAVGRICRSERRREKFLLHASVPPHPRPLRGHSPLPSAPPPARTGPCLRVPVMLFKFNTVTGGGDNPGVRPRPLEPFMKG